MQPFRGICRLVGTNLLAMHIGAGSALAVFIPAGPQVPLEGDRAATDVCLLADGDFAVVHQITNQSSQIFVQRYDTRAEEVGGQITDASLIGIEPRIDCDPAGGFIVAWSHADGIVVQRFDAADAIDGPQILVAPRTSAYERLPDVSIASDSSFVVAWQKLSGTTFARMYDSFDSALGPAFETGFVSLSDGPDVEHGPDDAFLVTYETIYDAAGNVVSGNGAAASTACYLANGNIALMKDGLVGWVAAPDGTFITGYINLGQVPGGLLQYPSLSCNPDGTLLLLWEDANGIDGHSRGVRARLLDSLMSPLTDEFNIASTRGLVQSKPRAATNAAGITFVTWNSAPLDPYPGTYEFESFARRYCDDANPGCSYACPYFDDGVDPDGDGVAAGCDRCEDAGGAIVSRVKLAARTRPKHWGLDHFNKLLVKGSLVLPAHLADLATVAPDALPLRISVHSNGGDIVNVTLPTDAYGGKGTAGWTTNGSSTIYKYADNRPCSAVGPEGAVNKVVIKDLTQKTPGLVRFTIKGKGRNCEERFFTFPTGPFDGPPSISLAFGAQDGADNGDCAEVDFDPAECNFRTAPFTRTACKR